MHSQFTFDVSSLVMPTGWTSPQLGEKLGEGSFGRTHKLMATGAGRTSRQTFTLKVLAKFTNEQADAQAVADFAREAGNLQDLRDVRLRVPVVLCHGLLQTSVGERPYLIYDFIDAVSLADFRGEQKQGALQEVQELRARTVADAICSAYETVVQFQTRNLRHFDLQPNNILLRKQIGIVPCVVEAHIIDFGKSVFPELPVAGALRAPTMPEFMEENLKSEVIRNRGLVSVGYAKNSDTYVAELYALGKSFESWIQRLPTTELDTETGSVLKELLKELTSNLPYKDRRRACDRLVTLLNRRLVDKHPVLIRIFQEQSARIDADLLRVIDTPAIQRLRKVMQLGTTHLLYPGATHNRFVHTLGVVDLASRYFDAALMNDPRFVEDPNDARIAVQIYALLHDVGHFPFAHYIEEIDGKSMPQWCASLDHELLGEAQYSDGGALFDSQLVETLRKVKPDFSTTWLSSHLGVKGQRTPLGRIVDGPIDCDKLDYLIRDAVACGIAYAHSIDVERLTNEVVRTPATGKTSLPDFGITQKGVAAVQALAHARAQMYTEVYLHKTCRSMAACIKKAFWLLCNAKDNPSPLTLKRFRAVYFGLSDQEFLQQVACDLKRCGGALADAATSLLRNPFLDGTRRLHKRIWTVTSGRRNGSRSLEGAVLDKIGGARPLEFGRLDQIERKLVSILCERLEVEMPRYAIIVDALPRGKGTPDWPSVVLHKARGEQAKLEEVSPVVKAIGSAMADYQKVRIFAAPEYAELIKNLGYVEITKSIHEAVTETL